VKASAASSGSYCDNLGSGPGSDTLTLKFAGPQVGVLYGRSANGGKASVYVDGTFKGTIDFHSTSKNPAFVSRSVFKGLSTGTHTVKLVVTSGAAYVDDLVIWGPLA